MENDIFVAISKDDVRQLRRILANPATDVDALDWFQLTPLSRAAESGHLEAIKLLIRAGARLDVPGQRSSPQHIAATRGDTTALALLLETFDDPNLIVQSVTMKFSIVRIAMEFRIFGNCNFSNGWPGATALHFAAARGCLEVMQMLLNYPEIDPNVADQSERATPLHAAAMCCQPAAVQALLHAGADPHAQLVNGDTPLLLTLNRHLHPSTFDVHRTVALLVSAGDRPWGRIHAAYPGLEIALLSVWNDAREELPLLFQRLKINVQTKIRAALAALHRSNLPMDLRIEILAQALKADATFD